MRILAPTIRRTACTIAVAVAVAVGVLTACTGTTTTIRTPAPATTVPATPAASASASAPASAPAAGPATVAAPTSASAAIDAANQTLLGYFQASFTSAHAGGARLDLVTPWATGAALQNERTLATYLQKRRYHVDGAPLVWTLSTTKSVADTETTTTDRRTIPYGYVQLVGCTQSTNHPVGAGAPAWTTKNRWLHVRWTVIYDISKQQWRVNRQTVLGAKNGATTCDA